MQPLYHHKPNQGAARPFCLCLRLRLSLSLSIYLSLSLSLSFSLFLSPSVCLGLHLCLCLSLSLSLPLSLSLSLSFRFVVWQAHDQAVSSVKHGHMVLPWLTWVWIKPLVPFCLHIARIYRYSSPPVWLFILTHPQTFHI